LTVLLVLWALGWAMIVLSALVYLPPAAVTAFGLVMISTHNLFDPIQSTNLLWSILHVPGVIASTPRFQVFVAYPLIPWIGVTAVGYGLGQVYGWPASHRKAFLLRAGLAVTALFIVLRTINLYGDPAPWAKQNSAVFTALSFLDTTKYPPSLLFLLMTLGPALFFLRVFDAGLPTFCAQH
jgi:uncharacterized membrane protein